MSACADPRSGTVSRGEVPTVDHPVFDHEGPWTEEAYLALRSSGQCDGGIEVVDGTLVIGPRTTAHRAGIVARVREAVEAALPEGLQVSGPVPLRLGPDCILVPDLVVHAASAEDGPEVLDATATLMVVEVIGRDHGAVDRTFKPQLYARSRIPYSLMIDHDTPFAVANMIISGRYHEYSRAAGEQPLWIEEPFVLEIDMAAATAPDVEAPSH